LSNVVGYQPLAAGQVSQNVFVLFASVSSQDSTRGVLFGNMFSLHAACHLQLSVHSA
jgi:hypothetical protein